MKRAVALFIAIAIAIALASASIGGRKRKAQVYDETADAHALLTQAINQAHSDGKRILVVFGANWCAECLILDAQFHKPQIRPVVDGNFHVVHVDIGRGDTGFKNRGLQKAYSVQVSLGIPRLAVLDSNGKLIHADDGSEWAPHGGADDSAVLKFLQEWKPTNRSAH